MRYPTPQSGPNFNFQTSNGSTKLIIFFSGAGLPDGSFNYWKLGARFDTHRLFVNDSQNRWYQSGIPGLGASVDETVSTIRRWVKKLGVTEIYTIGPSMGAFGAVLYGGKLGARVLAFGPETIIGLEGSRSARLMRKDTKVVYPDLHEVIANSTQPIFILVGEKDPVDLYCLSKASVFPNCQPRTVTDLGHDTGRPMHARNQLVPMINRFISNQDIRPLAKEGNALAHPGFAEAYYDLNVHMKAHRFVEAIQSGRLALAAYKRSDQAFYITAKAFLSLEHATRALPLVERALKLAPNIIGYRFLMARSLAKLGEYDRAIAIYDAILVDRPDFANAFYQLATVYLTQGKMSQALATIGRAIELQPDTPLFIELLKRIKAQPAGKAEERTAPQAPKAAPASIQVEFQQQAPVPETARARRA
jgi:tetratricopeptide (TPR) repeat protein